MAVLVAVPGVDLSIRNYEGKTIEQIARSDWVKWWGASENVHFCVLYQGKDLNFAATSISMFFFQVEKQQDCLIYNSWHPRVLTKRHNIRSERFWGMLLSLFRNFIENVWRSLWWNGRWVLVRCVLKVSCSPASIIRSYDGIEAEEYLFLHISSFSE